MTARAALLAGALAAAAAAAPSLSCGASLCFASGLSTGAVLQRAPAAAVLYGSAPPGSGAGARVTLALNATNGSYGKVFSGAVAADGTWRVVLDARPAGGDYAATVACAACAGGAAAATIRDLTFGDVWYCGGQSNMWLPLWFTFERNATTAAVLNGSYANIRLFRGGLGQVGDPGAGGNWVGPAGVEPGSDAGEALTNQWRRPRDVATVNIRDGEPWLWEYPATCFYFAQFLTDMLGAAAPPFGLMSTPVGGTMLEEWSAPETQRGVRNVTCMCMDDKTCNPYKPLDASCTKNSDLYWGNVMPFANITIKGWLWYQGENNLQYDGGNSADNTGYGALFPAMVAQWRALWSAAPGTTDALAPFGYVEIADGSDEAWGVSMAGLRWAQGANYGYVPNAALPNVFSAAAHDLGDPWDADACKQADKSGGGQSCCVTKVQPLGANCRGDHRGQWDYDSTNWFMGQVHPRPKMYVGQRLAQAAFASVYGGDALASGPVLAGCALAGDALTITFDAARLRGEAIAWSEGATAAAEDTALYVLVGAPFPAWAAANHHSGNWRDYAGPYASGNEAGVSGWVAVDARATGAAELTVDLSPLKGAVPTAVRYAWGTGGWGAPFINRMCCGPTVDVTLEPCAPDSCPLHAGVAPFRLPAVPFLAEIAGGVCKCMPPQKCDA